MLCRQSNLDVLPIIPEYRHFDNHRWENIQYNFQNTFSPSYVSYVRPCTIHCNTSHKVKILIGSNKEKGIECHWEAQSSIFAMETLPCTCHCTAFCIIWTGLQYQYDMTCLLLQICRTLRSRKDALNIKGILWNTGDRGSTVVKVLCYKSEGRWFDLSWCQRIFHWHNPSDRTMALGSTQPLAEISTRSISWG